MPTWEDYKKHIRETNPVVAQDLDEIEMISQIVTAMISRRHDLNLTQRDLAKLCNIPQSSLARIESGSTAPNLKTLSKIFNNLDLTLIAQPKSHTSGSAL